MVIYTNRSRHWFNVYFVIVDLFEILRWSKMSGDGTDNGGVYPADVPLISSGYLEVSPVHKLYYEECGVKTGTPVVFLHGGPGACFTDWDKRYFDPTAYRIVIFDQRGAGRSQPLFCIEDNDTWKIIGDIEKIREHLGIEKWVVFGGSWGSFLSLLYAQLHVERVLALIVQGIFTCRKSEIGWLYQKGASLIFPEYWDTYVARIPEEERDNLLLAHHKRITGSDREEAVKCALAVLTWNACNTRMEVNPDKIKLVSLAPPEMALKGCEYFMNFFLNLAFLTKPNEVLDGMKIVDEKGIPVTIIHGRYDSVAPMATAWELHKRLKNSEFWVVDNAVHSPKEVGTTRKLVEACNKYQGIDKQDK